MIEEKLKQFVESSKLSNDDLKELESVAESICVYLEKKKREQNVQIYHKLINDKDNKLKFFYQLKEGTKIFYGDYVVGEVVKWVFQFQEIYGEVYIGGIVPSEFFELELSEKDGEIITKILYEAEKDQKTPLQKLTEKVMELEQRVKDLEWLLLPGTRYNKVILEGEEGEVDYGAGI